MFAGLNGRCLMALAMLVFLTLPLTFAVAEDQTPMAGRYSGFGASEGVVVSLAEAGSRVVGTFTDAKGRVYTINGQRSGDGAQGEVVRGQESAFFHLELRPLGILFMNIPGDAQGNPDLDAATQHALARDGVDVDTLLGKAQRERQGRREAAARSPAGFLNAGSGRELARQYGELSPRVRELVRLFDHVQARLTARLCAAVEAGELPAEDRAVTLALERQQAGCPAIVTLRARAVQSDAYADFETRLAVQRKLLETTLACDEGELGAEECQTAGAMNAAMFEQWRRAAAIFADIADEGGTGAATVETSGEPLSLRGTEAGGERVLRIGAAGPSGIPLPALNPRR